MEANDDLEEDLKKGEEDEINPQDINPSNLKRRFKKMKTTNLSSFPDLISIKENPQQTEKIGEKKDLDKNKWIPDSDADNCYNCGSKFFTLLNRKHHCRVCGNIFCKSCLETFYEITIYNEKQELKVCAYCLEKKRELNKILKNNLVEYMNEKGKKIFKTKTWDYVVNKERNEKNIEKFCGFIKSESQLMREFHYNLDKDYETLLKRMINQILNEKADKLKFPNLLEDWEVQIYNMTNKVINNLSPSFLNLNDSININDYLKIKTIEYRNQSKCEVIDGFAMRKNICSKYMRTMILKPKILLLKGPLEGLRINRGTSNITNNIIIKSSAIEAYIEIIRKKIEEINPQIILVEGNVLQKFQNFFSMDKMNISAVQKVNINKLNKIARCVKSFVVPSPDLIGKNIVLGSCAKFEIQKIKKNISVQNRNNILHMKQEDYNLMRFEGCGKILFNTVILTGPNKEELKELKRLMKIIVKTTRYLYCQKFLLKYFNMLYEPSTLSENGERKEKNNKRRNRRKSSIYREDNYMFGFDTEIINEKSNEFDCIYMNLQNKNKIDTLTNTSLKATIIPSSEQDKNNLNNNNVNMASLKEKEVLKSTPAQCSACSYTMNAYSCASDEEKTLSQFIISFLEEAKEKCEKCGDNKLNHTSFIYKNNGRIRISIHNLNEQINSIDKIAEYLEFNESINKKKESEEDEIYSYGYCEQCNHIVTPLVKLPEEILNYSATKFYQNILYNKNLINFGDEKVNIKNYDIRKELFDLSEEENTAYNCRKQKHLHFKDISRIFMTKNGVVKFRYEEIIKYKLLGSQLNTKAEYYIKYNKENKIKEMAEDKILTLNALEALKNKFIIHKNCIENLKSENFSELINRTKKVVDDAIEMVEDLKKKNDQIFGDEKEYENIFVYNNNLRKYLLKIMNIKIISNKLLKEIKRVMKLIFFEEADEINKKAQEAKNIELNLKSGPEDGNNNSLNIGSKSLSENTKNKDNQDKIISQLEEKEENNNKLEINIKSKVISAPLIKNNSNSNINNDNDNKFNISNSSSFSDIDENDDENIENNENIQEENTSGNKDMLDINNKTDKIENKESQLKIEEKDKAKEENLSTKQMLDISLKKTIFSLNFFNTNPEVQKQLNTKFNSCLNEFNKYGNNILSLDKDEFISKIIYKLNYYDRNHSIYSIEVNDEDLCSVIAYALTSDQYLDSVKFDNKNGLNEIKSEFINNDMSNDVDNDLYCETSLLYDKEKVKFSLASLTDEKISQILKNELINKENKQCTYEVKYNPFSVFNEVFEKKSKKANKINTNSKINYTDFNQKLFSMNSELKNTKNDMKKIYKKKYDEIRRRFDFPKNDTFEEEKLPITEIKVTIYYTKHFESFRILYGATYFDFLHSIIKSEEWSSVTGGKSKALFFKSWDEKYVVKCLEEKEFNMFIESCFHYFVHNNKYFFFKMPSSLVKVVGAYKIRINSTKKKCNLLRYYGKFKLFIKIQKYEYSYL